MTTKIHTNADATRIEIIPLAAIDGPTLEPVTDRATGEVQKVDGQPLFRLRQVAVRFDGADISEGASVKVHTQPGKLSALVPVALSGSITITPWVADGSRQVRLSIVADGLATSARKAD